MTSLSKSASADQHPSWNNCFLLLEGRNNRNKERRKENLRKEIKQRKKTLVGKAGVVSYKKHEAIKNGLLSEKLFLTAFYYEAMKR